MADNETQPPSATEPADAPRALAQLRETLAPLYQDNPQAMCLTDRLARLIYANQAFIDVLDTPAELNTLQGQSLSELLPSQSRRTSHYIETLIAEQRSLTLHKILHLGPQQTPRAMQIRVQCLAGSDQAHNHGALITLQDDIKQYRALFAEEKLSLSQRIRQLSIDLMDRQALLKSLMDHSPFGIALLDKQRRIIQINRTAEGMLGISRSEARGILCTNLFQCYQSMQSCPILDNGRNITQQETLCAQPGKTQHTFLRSAVRSQERNEDIIIEAFIDFTEMKEAQQAREAAYRAKEEFFAKMSHELRTPLNAVIGFSELLCNDHHPTNSEEVKDYAAAIHRGGHDLLQLVNQVLDVAQLNNKKVQNHIQAIEISPFIAELCDAVQALVLANHNRLNTHCDPDISIVHADPQHLRTLLLQLLNNACKFTQDGDIQLSIRRERVNNEERIRFQVKDSGAGLSEEALQRVFEPFEQADNSTTRLHGGSGLGLTIAKELSALMGGHLDAHSQPGKGSTFTLSLPTNNPAD